MKAAKGDLVHVANRIGNLPHRDLFARPKLRARHRTQAPAGAVTNPTVIIPAGTKVELAITLPIWARSAAPGASVFAGGEFSSRQNGQTAIPAGTRIEGTIDTLKRPGLLSPHAQIQAHVNTLVFANGYAVSLYGPGAQTASLPVPAANDVIPAVSSIYVDLTPANDVLLDNGTQIEMLLQESISLDAAQVAAAISRSRPIELTHFESATQCRYVPGTPGTPDTVIPGTPGSSGTPDTVIPGTNGSPDIVIPGIPATAGTPDTVIPGTSGTPGTWCPGPPIVADRKPPTYKENFELSALVQLGGARLSPGSYQAVWTGSGPMADVEILQKKKVVARMTAHVFILIGNSPATTPQMSACGRRCPLIAVSSIQESAARAVFRSGLRLTVSSGQFIPKERTHLNAHS